MPNGAKGLNKRQTPVGANGDTSMTPSHVHNPEVLVGPMLRKTLGILMTAQAIIAVSTAGAQSGAKAAPAAQGGGPTACSIINADELKRLTGLKDWLGKGPVPADPSEVPKGVSECEYLGLSFSLTSSMTPKWFDDTRNNQVKSGTKTQPLTGVGDDAYYWWDPKPGSLRQVGIAFRAGSHRLVIMDITSSDSIEVSKPVLLTAAKATAPKLR
jgi:hypothetical protein